MRNRYRCEEAMEIVRKFDLLYRERRARISMDRSWMFPLGSVPMLSLDNIEHWASDNQIAAGKVLKNILSDNGVHVPDFIAICLNPTAGIAGPGNLRIFDPRPGTVMAVTLQYTTVTVMLSCTTIWGLDTTICSHGWIYFQLRAREPGRYPVSGTVTGIDRDD